MPKRNSPKDIKNLEDLSDLSTAVVDKRIEKRSPEKRNRRDRHYNKLFIKVAIKDLLEKPDDFDEEAAAPESPAKSPVKSPVKSTAKLQPRARPKSRK